MKQTYTLLTSILLGLFALVPTAFSEEVLPSLMALPGPGLSEPTSMADPTFPQKLEKEEDYASALLEWKRVAYTTEDQDLIEKALFRVAMLHYKMEDYPRTLQAFERFGEKFPTSRHIPEALYYMSLAADRTTNAGGAPFRARLLSNFKETTWAKQARFTHAWNLALSGEASIDPVYDEEVELAKRLEAFPLDVEHDAWMAAMLSFVPGAGHAYNGQWWVGLGAFAINAIFFFALFAAIRYKHWGYVFVFGLAVSIFYTGTIYAAHNHVYHSAYEARKNAMGTWHDLAPEHPLPVVPAPQKNRPYIVNDELSNLLHTWYTWATHMPTRQAFWRTFAAHTQS